MHPQVNGNQVEEVRVLVQVFVPELHLENILIGLQKCGVGVVAGTGFSLLPTSGEDGTQEELKFMHHFITFLQ